MIRATSTICQALDAGYERAWRRIMDDNPFPAIMGRVCYHPCETACNRAQLDEAVGINSVDWPQPQQLDSNMGKVLRINGDGSIPKDNPFVGRAGAHPEIYALGFRDVQGVAIHPRTGKLWTSEHGPRGGDEFVVPNWWMGMWSRKIGSSQLTFNTMFSLDPATVGKSGYREIFNVVE